MAQQYRSQTVSTSPQQLVVMCYDGMILFLNKARNAMEQGLVADKTLYINKTLAIVGELQSHLNFEVGGEIAVNLDRIYDYFSRELLSASVHNDGTKLEHLQHLMRELRGSWAKVAEGGPDPNVQRGVSTSC
jgi:flagellar protein FliS